MKPKEPVLPHMRNCGPDVRLFLTKEDYEARRPDGMFESSLAFAMDYLRRLKPEYSFDDVKTPAEMDEWRRKVRAKLRELLQIGEIPRPEFKIVSEAKRDGYRLYRYEFSPEERLVVPILVLVPERAIADGARVPAVICMPGSGASLNSLAGEPDDYANHFPLRNRQAWFYVKAGMVAVAIENPATAENGVDGVEHYRVQHVLSRPMRLAGRSPYGFMVEHVLETIELLKGHPNVDPARIAISGMSLGTMPGMYTAVLSDDVAAYVHNDFCCSRAIRAMAQTGGQSQAAAQIDPRIPEGAYRWFDDDPEVLAAIAPRPLSLSEGGPWKRHLEKITRAYALAGASQNLQIAQYAKYADPASRKYDDADLKEMRGLTPEELFEVANVDAPQHSFHPDINLPWLSRIFFGKVDFSPELEEAIRFSAAAPGAW